MANRKNLLAIVLLLSVALIVPAMIKAQPQLKTIKGKIEGALCVFQGRKCPVDDYDSHLALEHNFVLVTPDGSVYYMPNLDRSVKVRNVGKNVRVTGKTKGETILVEKLEVKIWGKYKPVWSRQKQKKEYIDYFDVVPMG